MLNLISSEALKLKHNKLILTCSTLGIFISVLFITLNVIRNDPNFTILIFISTISRFCIMLVFSTLSALVITSIIQKEYGDSTIINILTTPIERIEFLIGKLAIWAIWHMSFIICFLLILLIGTCISFGLPSTFEYLAEIIATVLKAGILSLLSLMPVACISILQRKAFYPSLIFSFVVISIGFLGTTLPPIINNIIPWCAIYSLSFGDTETIGYIPHISLALCSTLSFYFAIYSIKYQEL